MQTHIVEKKVEDTIKGGELSENSIKNTAEDTAENIAEDTVEPAISAVSAAQEMG